MSEEERKELDALKLAVANLTKVVEELDSDLVAVEEVVSNLESTKVRYQDIDSAVETLRSEMLDKFGG